MSNSLPAPRPRFLSEAECRDIAQRLVRYSTGGGETEVTIVSKWSGNVRWARNTISTTGEDRETHMLVRRNIRGAEKYVSLNDVTDEALVAALRRAERLVAMQEEHGEYDVLTHAGSPFRYQDEPVIVPKLFFESTYQLDSQHRSEAVRQAAAIAAKAGILSFGYLEVSANSMAYMTSGGYSRYYEYTWVEGSVTARDGRALGSGWAGIDLPDWTQVDLGKLTSIAVDKCLRSRDPVAIEPGRYTAVLEPQAVCDILVPLLSNWSINSPDAPLAREHNETGQVRIFNSSPGPEPGEGEDGPVIGQSRIGDRVADERVTIGADPTDPDLAFPPFDKVPYMHNENEPYFYHPTTWIEKGVLTNLAYDRKYAASLLGRNIGMPNSGAFRMKGGDDSIEDMIATTKRGLLVTRFDRVSQSSEPANVLLCGYTRDGLWLIENGKISKSLKNMMFVESPLFVLNNIEQLGPAQRVFHPPSGLLSWVFNPQPVIVPSLKVRDFSFTALSNAV